MNKFRFQDRTVKKRMFLAIFLAGFVTGVLYIALFGKAAVNSTTLMSPYFFSKYQYMEFASEELFLYILKSRISAFTLLWLMGLTVIGLIAVRIYVFWFGVSLGITITVAAMKMGMQGIVLCIASSLPQFVLYVPGGCWLLKKIYDFSGGELHWKQWGVQKKVFISYTMVYVAGLLLLLAGSFLESYVNPLFLKTFLKKI